MEFFETISILSAILYIIIGFAVAVFGTLIGAGGGIIFVPLFLWLFDWEPAMIIGTSLTIVFFNALFAVLAYNKQKRIRYDAAIPFGLATIPGAWVGATLADSFSGTGFRISFGIVLFLVALLTLWKSKTSTMTPQDITRDFSFSMTGGLTISVVIGFISSAFGIGGGVIHVPAMVGLLGFPPHIATATSQFVLAISSGIGVVAHALTRHIYWPPAILFATGAIIGATQGAKLSKKIRGTSILKLLAVTLLLLAMRLIFFP